MAKKAAPSLSATRSDRTLLVAFLLLGKAAPSLSEGAIWFFEKEEDMC